MKQDQSQDSKDQEFASEVSQLIAESVLYRDQLAADRVMAMQYWDGEMVDMPPRKGWSQVVSRDVSATIKKVLPSLMRTILGNEIIAEYSGHNENDVDGAEQATDFINLIAFHESHGEKAVHDAMHDACLLRNGILYVGIEEKTVVTGSRHTGLDENSFNTLVNDDEVEVLEHTQTPIPPEDMPPPDPMMMEQQQEAFTHGVSIKRTTKKRNPRISAVPPEEYLIHPDAIESQENAALVGREMRMSKSDLIAMGYDRDMVDALPAEPYNSSLDAEKFTRRKSNWLQSSPEQDELQQVAYYDLYVRLDYDGDGIAELRHVCMAGGMTAENVVMNEYADFVRYYDVVIERRPHQWEGVSVPDDVIEIQRVKTALMRYGMDNTYAHVNPQPWVNADKLKGGSTASVMNPEPGRPGFLEGTDKVSDAISWNITPYIADKAMLAVEYWDAQISDRTGIDDSSAGMPTDALQNVTAKASAMMEQKGIARTEMMVRTVAMCLKPVFAGLLKLIIQNQDKPRMVRLRDKWVEIDPRSWNAEMDVSINTGLGAGTRERDMMVMQNILAIQNQLVALFGPESPILKADNLYNAVEKAVQAAGIKSVGKFFTKPDPAEVKAAMEAKANQPSPEQQKVNAQIQLLGEQSKANAAKEQAQAQADLIVQQAKEASEARTRELDARQAAIDNQSDNSIKRYEIDVRAQIEREKIDSAERIAMDRNKHDLQRAQAESISGAIAGVKEEKAEKEPKSKEKPTKTKTTFNRDPKTGDLIGMETTGAAS
jgi:head-tail adaptor